MRLARNELKIAVATMFLLVLFAAVYLVIRLTGDDGKMVADAGDQPTATSETENGTNRDADGNTDSIADNDMMEPFDAGTDRDFEQPVPVIEDEPVDPFEVNPAVEPAAAGSAWDELFANGSDAPTLMQTPGADGSDALLPLDNSDDGETDGDTSDAQLSSGTNGESDTTTDAPATNAPATDEPTTNAEGQRTYVIKTGDSFYTIARDQLGDASLYMAIQQANPLVDPRRLRPGTKIQLPSPSQTTRESDSGNRTTSTEADLTIDGHVVKAGETLSGIAEEHYGKSWLWRDIYAANRDKLDSPGKLKVGMVLTIPDLADGGLGSD